MDRPAFSLGGFGAPPPPLTQQQQQQQYQPADSAVNGPDSPHAAMYMALGPFVQQNKGISVVDIAALVDHLEMLMKDCSQANIQAGKNWVVHFCQNPQQYDVLIRAMVNIAISRNTFDEKLHIVYLTNDVLSHSERKQQQWIKDAIHPHLVAMLRAAYFFPGINDGQRQRVIKVLDIWRTKEFFPPPMIDSMEMHVKRPPLLPNNGQGPTSPQEQRQVQGQQLPFYSPAHPHPQPPSQQFQFQHQQQQFYPQQQQLQQHYPHHQQQQFSGFTHHPQQQLQNQYPFPLHSNPQQMPHHPDPWTPPAPGTHAGFPPFKGNAPIPQHPLQHPPQGVSPPPFHHQPNPFPQGPPAFQNHQQQPPFQQPPSFQQPPPQPPFPHAQRYIPAPTPVSAPAPPPPEPTHRDVLTRDLHAGQMVSKVDDDADYYEPLPAYVSIPVKKKAHQDKDLLDSVAQFIQETNAFKAEDLTKGDEGWHEGQLDGFYRKHGDKRKYAFSDNPRQRRRHSRPQSDPSGHRGELRERGRSFSRTPSRSRSRSASRTRRRSLRSRSRSFSRSRSRSGSPQYRRRYKRRNRDRSGSRGRSRSRSRSRGRSMSRSRSRSRSRGRSRSVSRGRSRSRSRDAGPKHRAIEEAFPTRKFGLGSSSQQQQQSSLSRPSFQPARFSQ